MATGFIEVVGNREERHLINIRYIEEVMEGDNGSCCICLAHNCPNATNQDFYIVSEPYEVIKKVICGADMRGGKNDL